MTSAALLWVLIAAAGAGPPGAYEATGRHGVVAADHALASQVGVEVLKAGGDAVDAAVATALALGVLNPQSSGIGGGGFAIVWRAKEGKAYALDFRETAPGAARKDTYTRPGITPDKSLFGGLAVGVPGEVAGLAELHRRWGKAPWARVVDPAASLAREGFPCGQELAAVFERYGSKLGLATGLAELFKKPDGTWPKEGDPIVRPGLSKTLAALSKGGGKAFYEGAVGAAIVQSVRASGGLLTEADLKGYRVKERAPLAGAYRGRRVYTMPPPSSGGLLMLQVLAMLEARTDVPTDHGDPRRVGFVVEALKHGFADRARWYGDPDFAAVPVAKLLDRAALQARAAGLNPASTRPPGHYGVIAAPPDDEGTSHVSIIDAAGNAVALTTTINTGFGSLVVAGDSGVILNNEMDDFTTRPGQANTYGLMQSDRNSVAAGKRPLSSMTPTIVIAGTGKTARPELVVGASGGPRIITGTLQVLLNVIDHGHSVGRAVDAPRIHHQWQPDELKVEEGAVTGGVLPLEKAGHTVVSKGDSFGKVQAAAVGPKGRRSGASDPRKHGRAAAY